MYGDAALSPLQTWTRLWGTDPWTQGYVTNWRPGDVEAVGPLHGTHEPPFYVCGSDQWVAGYMEGAVRTGRAAARAALDGVPQEWGVLMDFGLTDEQRAVVATTRAFVEQELYPHEQEVERTGVLRPELAEEITQKAIRAGLHAANMPEEVGGAGLDTVTLVLYEKELGKANYALHSAIGRPSNILLAGTEAQKERYLYPSVRGEQRDCLALTEPAAGSDLRGMRTRAVRDERRLADQGHQALHQPRARVRLRDPVRRHRRARPTARSRCRRSWSTSTPPASPCTTATATCRTAATPTPSSTSTTAWVPDDALLGEEGKGFDLAGTWLGSTRSAGRRDAASAAPNGHSTSPYATPRSASSSARRSAASRASPSSSPTWPWSSGPPS